MLVMRNSRLGRGPLRVRKGDTVVFLGDSITEQQLYTNYVESYLVSRFPGLNLRFYNAGWGGDVAPGGLERLDRDVLSLKPSLVTICYGMNDAGYVFPTREIRERFEKAMRRIIARLKARGIRTVLFTPGFADVTASPALLKPVDYNRKGLSVLAGVVKKIARDAKLPVRDLRTLMTEVDGKAKRADRKFVMAPDGFHPDPAGHLVMAYGVLEGLGVPARRETVHLDLAMMRAQAGPGVRVSALQETAYGYSFELAVDRPPFFVEEAARKVLPFVPFQETYNELLLSCSGLKAGGYILDYPGGKTGILSASRLARGVNLFSIWNHPWALRAAEMHQFTLDKCSVYYKLWRSLGGPGGYGASRPHALGRRVSPRLDQVRERWAETPLPRMRLRLVQGDIKGSVVENGELIAPWSVRGVFSVSWRKDRLGGEDRFRALPAQMRGDWKPLDVNAENMGGCLGNILGRAKRSFAYAVTLIESPVDQEADLLVGSGDGCAVWLNGRLLGGDPGARRFCAPDQDRWRVTLLAGRNVLLLKVAQHMPTWWGFCARFQGLASPVMAVGK